MTLCDLQWVTLIEKRISCPLSRMRERAGVRVFELANSYKYNSKLGFKYAG